MSIGHFCQRLIRLMRSVSASIPSRINVWVPVWDPWMFFSPGNQNYKNDTWTEALPDTSADGRPLSKLYLSRPTLFQPPTPCCHDNLHHHPHHPHRYHLGYCTVCCHDGAFVDLKEKKKKKGKKKTWKDGARGGQIPVKLDGSFKGARLWFSTALR